MGLDIWADIFKNVGAGLSGAQEIKDKIRREMIEDQINQRNKEIYDYNVSRRSTEDQLQDSYRGEQIAAKNRAEAEELRRVSIAEGTADVMSHLSKVAPKGRYGRYLRDNIGILGDLGKPKDQWDTILKNVMDKDDPDFSQYPRLGGSASGNKYADNFNPVMNSKVVEDIANLDKALEGLETAKAGLMAPEHHAMNRSGVIDKDTQKPISMRVFSEKPTYEQKPMGDEAKAPLTPQEKAMMYRDMRKSPTFMAAYAPFKVALNKLINRAKAAKSIQDEVTYNEAIEKIHEIEEMMRNGGGGVSVDSKPGYVYPNKNATPESFGFQVKDYKG
jgi:hypothetical protein